MKTLPTLVATALALALVLSPMAVFAAGTITFSSPAANSSISGSQSYTITGTVSPAPGGADNVFIQVMNPSSIPVDAASVSVNPSTGAFSYVTAGGGSTSWVTGTYTIKATDTNGVTGSTTFSYTATATTVPTSGVTLEVFASGSFLVTPGQTAAISALVVWNNGTVPSSVNFTGSWLITPSGTASPAPVPTAAGHGYWWSIPITSSTPNGLYVVELKAAAGSAVAWGQASFTVNSGIASSSAVSALGQQVSANFSKTWTALSSMQTAITNAISSSQTAITNAITSAQSALSTAVGTATSAAQTAATDASNAQSNVSNVTTYILVVAILVAITLVLELAVLVRKLS